MHFLKINKFCFEQHVFPGVIVIFILKINGDERIHLMGCALRQIFLKQKDLCFNAATIDI